jgi:ribonuclease HI
VKTLKFNHDLAQLILKGEKTSTWRLYDDKDLSVDDSVKIVDKVDPDDPDSWQVIGLRTYKQYYGDRVSFDTPVKIINFQFTDSVDETPTGGMLLEEAKIFTDGGSRGNPGDSACAYVICKMDNTVVEKSGYYMGMATNNQAEYYGQIKGLERARDLGINKVNINSDSQLVVNQMNGLYKVKNQELAPLHQQLKALADSFEKASFHYIPRALNAEADKEVNRILDAQVHKK